MLVNLDNFSPKTLNFPDGKSKTTPFAYFYLQPKCQVHLIEHCSSGCVPVISGLRYPYCGSAYLSVTLFIKS